MNIGLIGYKGSGKTTAANIIKEILGDVTCVNFKDGMVAEMRRNFDGTLREMITALESQMYDGNCAMTIDWLFKNKPPLMRALMQNYGTEVRRKDDPDYWVHVWKETMSNITTHTIADDVRFLNEAHAVKEIGGVLIRIERTDMTVPQDHPSETEQREIITDHTITVGVGEFDKLRVALGDILMNYERLQTVRNTQNRANRATFKHHPSTP